MIATHIINAKTRREITREEIERRFHLLENLIEVTAEYARCKSRAELLKDDPDATDRERLEAIQDEKHAAVDLLEMSVLYWQGGRS